MKTAIIIDSTSYVNEGLRNHPDVYELFLTTTFEDGTQLLDSTDVKVEKGIYNVFVYEILLKSYARCVSITLSNTVRDTRDTAKMLIDEYKDQINGHVVASNAVSLIIGALVERPLDMIEIEDTSEDICRNTE